MPCAEEELNDDDEKEDERELVILQSTVPSVFVAGWGCEAW